MKTKNLRKNVMLLAPLFGLVALLVAFFIIGTSKNINVAYGMKSIINQSVVVAVVATGAIFIYLRRIRNFPTGRCRHRPLHSSRRLHLLFTIFRAEQARQGEPCSRARSCFPQIRFPE